MTSKELTTQNQALIDRKVVESYLFGSGNTDKLNDQQKVLFENICIRQQLDPFKREIYPIARKNRDGGFDLTIVTGYEVYLRRAEESGKLNGHNLVFTGKVPDLVATITIYRKDWEHPLVHTVDYSEYVQMTDEWVNGQKQGRKPNKMWTEKPKTMLRKVAICQGMRMAFPLETNGMPYASDELGEVIPVVDAEVVEKSKVANSQPLNQPTPSKTIEKAPSVPVAAVEQEKPPLTTHQLQAALWKRASADVKKLTKAAEYNMTKLTALYDQFNNDEAHVVMALEKIIADRLATNANPVLVYCSDCHKPANAPAPTHCQYCTNDSKGTPTKWFSQEDYDLVKCADDLDEMNKKSLAAVDDKTEADETVMS